jgi:hypothetical protein
MNDSPCLRPKHLRNTETLSPGPRKFYAKLDAINKQSRPYVVEMDRHASELHFHEENVLKTIKEAQRDIQWELLANSKDYQRLFEVQKVVNVDPRAT